MTEVSFKRIAIVVEGETELAFVNKILASHLLDFGVLVMPILSGKSGRGGGVRNWDATKRTIVHALRAIGCCSTMIDFYGLPNNWPSRTDAASRPPLERAGIVEDAISKAIIAEMSQSFNPQAFIPYLQLHEFEALAFSDISRLAEFAATISNQDQDDLHAYFQSIIVAAGHPEAINDFYETCPSRRISKKVSAYKKPAHGLTICESIGLQTMRNRCHHFGQWLERLESIGDVSSGAT